MEEAAVYEVRRRLSFSEKEPGFITKHKILRRIRAWWRLLSKFFRYKTPAEVERNHALSRYKLATHAWNCNDFKKAGEFYRLIKCLTGSEKYIAEFRGGLLHPRYPINGHGYLLMAKWAHQSANVEVLLKSDYCRFLPENEVIGAFKTILMKDVEKEVANHLCIALLKNGETWRGVKMLTEFNKFFKESLWHSSDLKTHIGPIIKCYHQLNLFLIYCKNKEFEGAREALNAYFSASKPVAERPATPYECFKKLSALNGYKGSELLKHTGNSQFYYTHSEIEKALEWNELEEGFYGPNAGIMYTRGVCLFRQGYKQSAIECLRKAVKLNPTHEMFRSHLAYHLFETEQEDEAIEVVSPAFHTPEVAGCYHHLQARLYERKAQFGNALREIKKAISKNPGSAEDYQVFQARIYIQTGKFSMARAILKDVLDANPLCKEAHVELAVLLEKTEGKTAAYHKRLAGLIEFDEAFLVNAEIREMVKAMGEIGK